MPAKPISNFGRPILLEFHLEDCGVSSSSTFQGVGVACSPWAAVYTGASDTLRHAISDAIENMAQVETLTEDDLTTLSEMELDLLTASPDPEASICDDCEWQLEGGEDWQDDHCDMCEVFHYAAVYVRRVKNPDVL